LPICQAIIVASPAANRNHGAGFGYSGNGSPVTDFEIPATLSLKRSDGATGFPAPRLF